MEILQVMITVSFFIWRIKGYVYCVAVSCVAVSCVHASCYLEVVVVDGFEVELVGRTSFFVKKEKHFDQRSAYGITVDDCFFD